MLTDTTTRQASSLVSVAEVLEIDVASRMLHVRMLSGDADESGWARLAISDLTLPARGDQVVVAGELSDQAFVIGWLNPQPPRRLQTTGGAVAEIVPAADGGEGVRIVSPTNELVFEYQPSTGTCRLSVPDGNLDVSTPKGGINFSAQGNIRLEAANIDVAARHTLLLRLSQEVLNAATRLRLLPGRIQVGTPRVDLAAEQIGVNAQSIRTVSEDVSTTSSRHEIRTEKLTTTAESVTERIGNVYRTVRDLVQLHAGRYRTYVSGLSHFRSKKAFFSSEESMNIDGDQVNIG
jgi:hypothetical protein